MATGTEVAVIWNVSGVRISTNGITKCCSDCMSSLWSHAVVLMITSLCMWLQVLWWADFNWHYLPCRTVQALFFGQQLISPSHPSTYAAPMRQTTSYVRLHERWGLPPSPEGKGTEPCTAQKVLHGPTALMVSSQRRTPAPVRGIPRSLWPTKGWENTGP